MANWNMDYGYCYCEIVGMGYDCEDVGSENYYELWTVNYWAETAAAVSAQGYYGYYDYGDYWGYDDEYWVYNTGPGDCLSTDEWFNGYYDQGADCALDCAHQGSFMSNHAPGYGYCYCEYADYYDYCTESGNEAYYELWSAGYYVDWSDYYDYDDEFMVWYQ